eukprot:CAMPEP_0177653912 /NCGR_PEP_ID=MMETSP0447-20121125/14006_1 /TAXON_ID=0 /ORGANISM="Stygamoeba regulata, Strain BSH-02190019" /LENGTH=117 /DNA_ID=CAMNT_0019157435 /DNA_START=8 /DNA_END=361 /DNA_ORIENTATION=-
MADIPEISKEDLKKLVADKVSGEYENFFLIDVRDPEERSQAMIEGSVNIPVSTIGAAFSADDATWTSDRKSCKPKEGDRLVFHCRTGRRATRAATEVSGLGYSNVKVYKGDAALWND